MSDDFNKNLEQFKGLLENENMADTIKMVMTMLEGNKKTDDKPSMATSNDKNNSPNYDIKKKEATQSETLNNKLSMDKGMDTIIKIKNIYDKINTSDDSRVNLLMALKPYLSDERKTHIDTAIKLVNVSKISTILTGIDNI